MRLKGLHFVVVVLLALALVPVGAHLLALPNKIDLPQEQYFTAQGIYLGWALPTGIVLISAIVATLVLAIAVRGTGKTFWFAAVAFVSISATLVIFFIWTQPTNQATTNWTVVPVDWESLRTQWEYSHATNAVLTFIALCAALASALTDHSDDRAERLTRRSEPAGVR